MQFFCTIIYICVTNEVNIMDGIVTLDLHGKTEYQARITIDAALRRSRGVYRIRCIHGCHGGTVLRDLLRRDYACKVLRLQVINEGTTDLVLREF